MTGRSYVHPSHVEYAETAAPHPTRDQLRAEQELAERRRERAIRARTTIRGSRHDH